MTESFDKLPGLFMWAASLAAFASPRIRLPEDEIPDALPGEDEEQDRDSRHDER